MHTFISYLTLSYILFTPFFSDVRIAKPKEFDQYELLPEPSLNERDWKTYLKQAIIYPEEARKNSISGTVHLDFLVTRAGEITDVKIIAGPGSGLNEEAIRILKIGPKWKPGIKEGKPVDMRRKYNIYFNLPINDSAPNPNAVKYAGDFVNFDVIPEYQGGMKGWENYLKKNLNYPAEALKNQIQGRVILSFLVTKDGEPKDIRVFRSLGHGTDEEAIRLLKESQKWKPGIRQGKPVDTPYTMPIFFRLN